jgi:hypothetical protein
MSESASIPTVLIADAAATAAADDDDNHHHHPYIKLCLDIFFIIILENSANISPPQLNKSFIIKGTEIIILIM